MNIRKLAILICLCFVKITTAEAEPYFGLNIGASILTVQKDITYSNSSATLSDYNTGFRAQLLAGYNFYPFNRNIFCQEFIKNCLPREKLYFSLEGDLNFNSGSAKSNISRWFLSNSAAVESQLNFGYDVFALAKYRQPQNIIWFFGPGLSWGNFNVQKTSSTGGNLGFSGSNNSWLGGWSIKTGVEIVLHRSIHIVATYQYTNFSSTTRSKAEPLTGVNVSTQYQPAINAITIGLNISDFSSIFFEDDSVIIPPMSHPRVHRVRKQKVVRVVEQPQVIIEPDRRYPTYPPPPRAEFDYPGPPPDYGQQFYLPSNAPPVEVEPARKNDFSY